MAAAPRKMRRRCPRTVRDPSRPLPAPDRQQRRRCYSWPADQAAAACSEFAAVCIRQARPSHADGPCSLFTAAAWNSITQIIEDAARGYATGWDPDRNERRGAAPRAGVTAPLMRWGKIWSQGFLCHLDIHLHTHTDIVVSWRALTHTWNWLLSSEGELSSICMPA